jgi:hypothetical protein
VSLLEDHKELDAEFFSEVFLGLPDRINKSSKLKGTFTLRSGKTSDAYVRYPTGIYSKTDNQD